MPDTKTDLRPMPRWVPKASSGLMPPQPEPAAGDDIIDVGALIATIWRGKWRLLAWMTLALLAGAVHVFVLATPAFRATTSLVLETREGQVVDFESVIGGLRTDSSAINTEVEILKGRLLMGRVADQLDLASDPEFNGMLRPPGLLATTVAYVRGQGLALVGGVTEPDPPPSADALRDRIITALIGKVEVTNTPLSLVFTVTVQTEDGRKSALIADTIAGLYIADQIGVKYQATEQATAWLAQRITELQVELDEAETRVTAFRAGTDVVDPAALEQADQQMVALRGRLAELAALRDTAAIRLAGLQAATVQADQLAIAGDAVLTRLAESGANLSDPAYLRRWAEVLADAGQDVSRADAQIAALGVSRDALQATISRQSDAMSRFQQLTRQADSVRLIHGYFLNRLQETSVQQGLQQADSRILSPAVVPERAASPQKPRTLAIALALGLVLGIAAVFIRDMRAKGFRTGRDLERITGYPVMGQIPLVRGRSHQAVLSYLTDRPASVMSEAVRNLRTSVLLANSDAPPRIIMVTSALPSEGKTTTALALVQNLAGLKRRVLLIDGDLRHRAVTQLAGALTAAGRDSRGPTGVTADQAGGLPTDHSIVRNALPGVDVLTPGPAGANAADIFSSDDFAGLLDRLRDDYDLIVIDTPPVLLVPDARVIAQHADAILFVVRWNATTAGQVRDGLRLLESVRRRATGLVLSQINFREVSRYPESASYGFYAANARSYFRN